MAAEPASHPRRTDIEATHGAGATDLQTLTYRSRSTAAMSELDLHRLAKAAQHRNRAEGVTGMLVYDAGWIFQQLEGPAAGLARIWQAIQRDPRHDAIEVLNQGPLARRCFDDWDLRLSVYGAGAGCTPPAADAVPPDLVSRLYRGEQPLHLLVSAWTPAVDADGSAAARDVARALLSRLIPTLEVPQWGAAGPAASRAPATPYPDTAALADLLMAADPQPAITLLGAAHAADATLDRLAVEVIEPAARRLGDRFRADHCSEIDVTLGLWRLQHLLRELGAGTPRLPSPSAPRVLVATPPGEVHMLGAVLDSELLWLAGWSPQVDFPVTAAALDALVAERWIDVLDLALSPALAREHRLAKLGETITRARRASLNPQLLVVVSGRICAEPGESAYAGDAAREVGADAGFGSAAHAQGTILELLHPSPPRR
jgi:methanogenic corrinoid protein MtbC1